MNNIKDMRKNITIIASIVLVVLLIALGFVFITKNNVKQLQTSIRIKKNTVVNPCVDFINYARYNKGIYEKDILDYE